MVENTRYGDGSIRPVNATTHVERVVEERVVEVRICSVTLREPESGETCVVDARVACVPAGPSDHLLRLRRAELTNRTIIMVGEVETGTVYVPSQVGGDYHRWEIHSRR